MPGVDTVTSRPLPSGPAIDRPREPRATPLYRLLETRYETVKGEWEERSQVAFRLLAGMRRWSRRPVSRLRHSRQWLRPRPLRRVPQGHARGLLLQEPRALSDFTEVGIDLQPLLADRRTQYVAHEPVFCREARMRIETNFRVFSNHDDQSYRPAAKLLTGDYDWLGGQMVEPAVPTAEQVEEAVRKLA